MKSFYITTPIYYVNAEPHLGHAYSTVVADVARRYRLLAGYDARMQTGTDEHGDKIAQAAAKEGIEPGQYADRISAKFREAWPPLGVAYDRFIRTTEPGHKNVVQAILQKVWDNGDIYKATYSGKYCVGCERFLTEHEMVEGKCPDHGTEPEEREEENYFFKMTSYLPALKEHIEANPDFIRPERYKNEVLAMLDQGLEDLCISRPKSRLTWGIELPFDPEYVTYVWFDALINYVSGLGWPDGDDFGRYWSGAEADPQHLIAKDILKPHAIYWPTMLMAAGIPLYRHLNVHGYWNVGEGKMSKSRGNVVRPLDLYPIYGVDAFRYFLLREMSFGLDAAFSEDALVARYNSDLANDLGNLFSRVLNMLHKYRGGAVPPARPEAEAGWTDEGNAAEPHRGQVYSTGAHSPRLGAGETAAAYRKEMGEFRFHVALAWVWDLMDAANKFVVRHEPWALAKDEAKAAELDHVLHLLCQRLADLTVMISPVMPQVSAQMASMLGMGEVGPGMLEEVCAGRPLLAAGAQAQKPAALFPRIDTKKKDAEAEKPKPEKQPKPKKKKDKPKAPAAPPEEISIDQFGQVDLKLGTVREAHAIEGADKLLRLVIDLGEGQPRQVVAGIAQHYRPEELPGRQVVVVANLKPVKLRGVESRGMVLACVDGDRVRLVSPDMELSPGAKVR